MNRFLKNILLFSCIVCLLFLAGEIVVRNLPSSYSYKDRWMRQNGDKVSTLILGSSHTYYGVKPDVLGDSTFNLANIYQTPEYDRALLDEYLPLMSNLKKIIISVSYFTFREQHLEDVDPALCVEYKVGMKLPLHSDFSKYNLCLYSFEDYIGRLRGLLVTQEWNICDSLGFGLGFDLNNRSIGWEEYGKKRAEGLTRKASGRPEEVLQLLEQTVELCNRNGIECILVTTPVWKTFRENTDKEQYVEMQVLTHRLVSKYGLKYLDLYDSELFTDEDFHDPDHLSDVGAEKFTRILVEFLSMQ
ncbi:MAG: hypothetical protein K2M79_05755 [Muribaculaceae bacterium]|nr:hypothetical protein [Muribaculaceae bacterium]